MPNLNDEYWDLVFSLVPEQGEAETEQGELVRSVMRLSAECCRNGCGNWDAYFEDLADFAAHRFGDGTIETQCATLAIDVIKRLRDYGRELARTNEQNDKVYSKLCDDIDDALETAAVEWCQSNPDPIPNQNKGK